MQDSPGEVTLLLAEMKSGNREALPKLVPLVYHELKRLAAHFLRTSARATPCSPPRWCMRRTCGWPDRRQGGRTAPSSWVWRRN